jgi:hypothetical protein
VGASSRFDDDELHRHAARKAIEKRVRKARGATSRAAVAGRHGRIVTRRVTHAAGTSDACTATLGIASGERRALLAALAGGS